VEISEIAAAPAGDENFLADAIGALQHGNAPPAFACLDGAEEPRGASAENQTVKLVNHLCISFERRTTGSGFPRRLVSRLN
jgi:hypothetical protein